MSGKHSDKLLVGIHSVEAALERAAGQIRAIYVAGESRNARVHELERKARELGVRVMTASRAALERRSDGGRHQDIIAEFARPTPGVKRTSTGCWRPSAALPWSWCWTACRT
ncbi:MAG: hypothetical protein HKP03_09080, partial [Xanthomonadales bacterium]|nr:hypothetical protein [Xanthomonadales bacterium]